MLMPAAAAPPPCCPLLLCQAREVWGLTWLGLLALLRAASPGDSSAGTWAVEMGRRARECEGGAGCVAEGRSLLGLGLRLSWPPELLAPLHRAWLCADDVPPSSVTPCRTSPLAASSPSPLSLLLLLNPDPPLTEVPAPAARTPTLPLPPTLRGRGVLREELPREAGGACGMEGVSPVGVAVGGSRPPGADPIDNSDTWRCGGERVAHRV